MPDRASDRDDARARLRAALDADAPLPWGDAPGAAGEAAHPDDAAMALYLAGGLEGAQAERFEAHVSRCGRCASDVAVALRVEREAASAGAGIRAPAPEPSAAPADERGGRAQHAAASHAGRDLERAAAAERPSRAARMPRRRGRTLRRLAIAAGVVLVATTALFAVAGRMALDRLQPLLVGELAQALHRDVSARGLGFALLGGPGLRVAGLHVGDDPRFSQSGFADVEDARLRVDVAELLRGRLRGSVELDDAVLRLVRGPGGDWNVESLGGRSLGALGTAERGLRRPPATTPRGDGDGLVRLTSVAVRDGRVEISDRSRGTGRAVVVRQLDLDVQSPDPARPAHVSLDGVVGGEGDLRKLAVDGEIGPFTRGETPRWQLSTVRLDRVPVSDIPGAPESLRGDLSFTGHIETSGDAISAVVANAAGGGDLDLCCGAIAAGNLGRELVDAFGREIVAEPGAPSIGDAILAAASREPAVAAVLTSAETGFGSVRGAVDLTGQTLAFRELAMMTTLFGARASGALSRSGALAASGTVDVEPALAALIARAAPAVQPLLGGDGRLAVPFRASGTWPRLALEVDLARAVAAAAHLDPRTLDLAAAFAPGLGRTPLAALGSASRRSTRSG
jgi:hypothetical protein